MFVIFGFFSSFVYFGPEGISSPLMSTHISCDSAMVKSYHKSCSGYDSLQRSDECLRQNLSAPQMKSWLLANNPSLCVATETPCSSQGSTDSSGYSSDTSQCEPHSEQSSFTKMFHLQGSCKRLSCHDKKKENGIAVMNTSSTYPPLKSNNYENFCLKDSQCTPPLPPKLAKKTPYYENHHTELTNSKTSSLTPPSAQTQSTCNPASPTAEGLSRLMFTVIYCIRLYVTRLARMVHVSL